MHAHHLIKSLQFMNEEREHLRKHRYVYESRLVKEENKAEFREYLADSAGYESVIKAISEAEKFEVPDLFDMMEDNNKEVDETIKVLEDSDLFRLPYPVCYIECLFKNGFKIPIRMAALVDARDGKLEFVGFWSKMLPGIKGWPERTFHTQKSNYRHTSFNLTTEELDTIAGKEAVEVYIHGSGLGKQSVSGQRVDMAAMMCQRLVTWLVFLLSSRGTSRIEYDPPEKLNKIRLKHRDVPLDGYTKVLLPGFVVRQKEDEISTRNGHLVEERKRPRLHWRRGHLRSQHYGQGRKLEKSIFIGPVLVGYEEEGRIYHLQYGQELSAATLK